MRCGRCAGSGTLPITSKRRRPCPRCNGDGLVCEGMDGTGDPCGRPVVERVDGEDLCHSHAVSARGWRRELIVRPA